MNIWKIVIFGVLFISFMSIIGFSAEAETTVVTLKKGESASVGPFKIRITDIKQEKDGCIITERSIDFAITYKYREKTWYQNYKIGGKDTFLNLKWKILDITENTFCVKNKGGELLHISDEKATFEMTVTN